MLVAVASVKGSPGATTVALALAACWPAPGRPVVMECDPAGGDIAARFGLVGTAGLVGLAAAARHTGCTGMTDHIGVTDHRMGAADVMGGTGRTGLIARQAQVLPGGVPVVCGPAGSAQARAALSVITASGCRLLRDVVDREGAVIVADCGRWVVGSPSTGVLRAADVVLLVCRPRVEELSHLSPLAEAVREWPGWAGLVLAGRGAYLPEEIGSGLHLPVVAWVPDDRRAAAVLAGRAGTWRRVGRLPLLRCIRGLAVTLAQFAPPAPIPGLHQPDQRTAAWSGQHGVGRRWLRGGEAGEPGVQRDAAGRC